jgi:hypothetical protein
MQMIFLERYVNNLFKDIFEREDYIAETSLMNNKGCERNQTINHFIF